MCGLHCQSYPKHRDRESVIAAGSASITYGDLAYWDGTCLRFLHLLLGDGSDSSWRYG